MDVALTFKCAIIYIKVKTVNPYSQDLVKVPFGAAPLSAVAAGVPKL